MSRETEFEQKIEILTQHLAVTTELLETLILKMNYDGHFPAASLLAKLEAISELDGDEVSGHRRQLLTQITRNLSDADRWTPPSQRTGKQKSAAIVLRQLQAHGKADS